MNNIRLLAKAFLPGVGNICPVCGAKKTAQNLMCRTCFYSGENRVDNCYYNAAESVVFAYRRALDKELAEKADTGKVRREVLARCLANITIPAGAEFFPAKGNVGRYFKGQIDVPGWGYLDAFFFGITAEDRGQRVAAIIDLKTRTAVQAGKNGEAILYIRAEVVNGVEADVDLSTTGYHSDFVDGFPIVEAAKDAAKTTFIGFVPAGAKRLPDVMFTSEMLTSTLRGMCAVAASRK